MSVVTNCNILVSLFPGAEHGAAAGVPTQHSAPSPGPSEQLPSPSSTNSAGTPRRRYLRRLRVLLPAEPPPRLYDQPPLVIAAFSSSSFLMFFSFGGGGDVTAATQWGQYHQWRPQGRGPASNDGAGYPLPPAPQRDPSR